jgi:predicted MFS family arabinose efflux permease
MTRFKRKLRSDDDGAARIIIALLAGAGGAFLLAIVMLASRLSDASDEGTRSAPGLVRGIVTAGIAGGAWRMGYLPHQS